MFVVSQLNEGYGGSRLILVIMLNTFLFLVTHAESPVADVIPVTFDACAGNAVCTG